MSYMLFLLCAIPFVLLLVVMIVLVFIRNARGSAEDTAMTEPDQHPRPGTFSGSFPVSDNSRTGRISSRIQDDGFWLDWPADISAGSRIRYEYWVGGQVSTGEYVTPVGSRSHFIFTSRRPEKVVIRSFQREGSSYIEDDDRSYTTGGLAGSTSRPVSSSPTRTSNPFDAASTGTGGDFEESPRTSGDFSGGEDKSLSASTERSPFSGGEDDSLGRLQGPTDAASPFSGGEDHSVERGSGFPSAY